MSSRDVRQRWVYRALLRTLPSAFRERHASEMERVFRVWMQSSRRRFGFLGEAFVWVGAVLDLTRAHIHAAGSVLRRREGEAMRDVMEDIRLTVRNLVREPGFALVVIATLALGIGANTAVFSVVNGVLIRPLPYGEPERLGLVWGRMTETSVDHAPLSGLDVLDFRDRAASFDGVAAMFAARSTLTGDFEPEQVVSALVTTNFFEVLRVEAALGRSLLPEDHYEIDPAAFNDPNIDTPATTAVLSHGLWTRRFGADPGVLGTEVRLQGQSMVIVGVMPAGFRLHLPAAGAPPGNVDLWTPMGWPLNQGTRDQQALVGFVRLAEGANWTRAAEELRVISAELRAENQFHANVGMEFEVVSLHDDVVRHVRPLLVALLGAVALVLLIACANVANLLVIRAHRRVREMGVRVALGAGRGRIVRQVLTESAVLAVLGSAAGIGLAWFGVDAALRLRPDTLPRADAIGIDPVVLAFTLAITVVAALSFGVIPAVRASGTTAMTALRTRSGEDRGGRRLRNGLVALEVALSLVLLIGGGLLLRTFASLQRVDPGFSPDGVLVGNLTGPRFGASSNTRTQFFRDVHAQLSSMPGLSAVGGVSPLPLTGQGHLWFGPFALTDDEQEWSRNEGDYRVVTPGFFEAAGTELLRGRRIEWADNEPDAAPVIVIDEKMAERAWPGEDPIGRELRVMRPVDDGAGWDRYWATVVGVVEHVRYDNLRTDGRETIYFPVRDWSWAEMSFLLRSDLPPEQFAAPMRAAVASVDPESAVAAVRTFSSLVEEDMATSRFALLMITAFAGIALALAVVGLYGVISYAVRQRTAELGIRLVFGADARALALMVLREGLAITLVGLVAGALGAYAFSRSLEGLLFGVGAGDPLTFLVLAALLAAVSALACWIPARRATRVDPAVALRAD